MLCVAVPELVTASTASEAEPKMLCVAVPELVTASTVRGAAALAPRAPLEEAVSGGFLEKLGPLLHEYPLQR